MFRFLRRWYLSSKGYLSLIKEMAAEKKLLESDLKELRSINRGLIKQVGQLQGERETWPNVKFEPWGNVDRSTVDWCKNAIVKTGMGFLLEEIIEIRVGADEKTDVLTGVSALATVQGGIIYLDDKGWMPGWDLPGTIIHEAVHAWQIKEGLTGNPRGMEIGAYSIQQVFEFRYCQLYNKQPRNLFRERLGAIGLL